MYLARPEPLALAGEVEYELEKNGTPIGLYDIKKAGQEQGLWVGYGAWKPLPSAKPAVPKPIVEEGFDANDDKPVLHRRQGGDSGNQGSSGQSARQPIRTVLLSTRKAGAMTQLLGAPALHPIQTNPPCTRRTQAPRPAILIAATLIARCCTRVSRLLPTRTTANTLAALIPTVPGSCAANLPAMALMSCRA